MKSIDGSRIIILVVLAVVGCRTETVSDSESGFLRGSVEPPNARATVIVSANDVVVVETTSHPTSGLYQVTLSPGRYDILVVADGYDDDASLTDVEIVDGQTTDVGTVVLQEQVEPPPEGLGILHGTVQPSSALPLVLAFSSGELVADGRPNRETGEYRVELLPGTHDITFVADGFLTDDSLRGVVITEGEVTEAGETVLFRAGMGSIAGTIAPPEVEATITALQAGAVIASTTSGDDGSYLMGELPIGVYELVATALGWERASVEAIRVNETETTVVDTMVLEESTTPTGSLHGVVLPPESAATVTAVQDTLSVASTTCAAEDGSWTIDGLGVGVYDIVIESSGYGADRSLVDIEVRAGESRDTGTVTLEVPESVISGQITDQDSGAPVSGVQVSLGGVVDVTGPGGFFSLPDPSPGLQTIRAERSYYLPYSALIDVSVSGSAEISMTLVPTGRVEGAITDSGGRPIEGAVVRAGTASSTTNPTGHYLLIHLRPGTYQVRVEVEGYSPARATVDTETGTTSTRDISLEEAGSVRGTITDSTTLLAISGALVIADGRVAISDDAGEYLIDGVAAGSHTVSVSARAYEDADQLLTVSAGGMAAADFDLTPVPRVTVTGRVIDGHTGDPVAGFSVYAGTGYEYDGRTDSEGYYTIPRSAGDPLVPVDITSIRTTSSTEFPPKTLEVDLTPGIPTGSVDIDIMLDRYASVFGRVVDSSTGDGIADVLVSCGSIAYTNDDGFFSAERAAPGVLTCYQFGSTCYPLTSQSIELGSGERREVVFLARRYAEVNVNVLDRVDDSPLIGAEVNIAGGSDTRFFLSGPEGVAHIDCLAPGLRTLLGTAHGYSSASTTVLVPASGDVEAWLRLSTP